MKTRETEPQIRKARALRAKYLKDRKALYAKFKADASAIGCVLVADQIAKVAKYRRQITALPDVRKHPKLEAALNKTLDDLIAGLKADAI
jgi:hypothetical protein